MQDRAMTDLNTAATLRGAITGLYGDVLQGWALDASKRDMRLVVEVCVDGSSVAFVRAEHYFPCAIGGDGFNGFTIHLKASVLKGARAISARIANQASWLEGTLELPAPLLEQPIPAASQVWHTGGLKLSGWAWDARNPDRQVIIQVLKDHKSLAFAVADLPHHALVYRDSNKHGFEIDLPWELTDGRLHMLQVTDDLGNELAGSPISMCVWPEGVKALLQQRLRCIEQDRNGIELLEEVAGHQETLLPKSAGFSHYPKWFDAFQSPSLSGFVPRSKCGILILGKGVPTLEATTLCSVQAQRSAALDIQVATSSDLVTAIERLEAAGCTSFIPVHAGDRLPVHAVDALEPLLENGAAWGYGDCDQDDDHQQRSNPWFKPVWDIDLFIGYDLFSPGAIIAMDAIRHALDLTATYSSDMPVTWELIMAGLALFSERECAEIMHLPKVVYHRHPGRPHTPAVSPTCSLRESIINWLVGALVPAATASPIDSNSGLLRAHWPLPAKLPRVSILIPTRDQVKLLRTCVEGVLGLTDYPDIEIIIVDNDSSELETLRYLREVEARGVKILPHPYPFNYPAVNNRAAEIATGEIVCLLNNDIEILNAEWLKEMVSQLLRPGVGAVGAKLLWANGMVQHGGVVIGINGLAAHAGNSLHDNDSSHMSINQLAHRRSSATGACLLMRRELYLAHGGMDETAFPVAFNDVDLCLRLVRSGLHCVVTPFAKLIHAESASRGKDHTIDRRMRAQREQANFIQAWDQQGEADPYYSPNLSHDYLSGPYGGLALPPKLHSSRSNRAVYTAAKRSLKPLAPLVSISLE